MFEHALGRGPDGATYQPPELARRSVRDRTRAWFWYRFGIGHRPQPRFAKDRPPRSRRR